MFLFGLFKDFSTAIKKRLNVSRTIQRFEAFWHNCQIFHSCYNNDSQTFQECFRDYSRTFQGRFRLFKVFVRRTVAALLWSKVEKCKNDFLLLLSKRRIKKEAKIHYEMLSFNKWVPTRETDKWNSVNSGYGSICNCLCVRMCSVCWSCCAIVKWGAFGLLFRVHTFCARHETGSSRSHRRAQRQAYT